MPRQITNFSGACARCRAKKLKCDKDARVCANCGRAKTPCIEIDPVSGEHYERGYIEDLKARAAYLRAAYLEAQGNRPYAQAVRTNDSTPLELQGHGISPNVRSIAGSSSKATGTPKFTDGSIFSLGHLVAAALSMHFSQGTGFQAGSLLQPQTDGIEISLSDEDNLPPLSEACDLTDAYFEIGFHRVSPFMSKSRAYEQIERLYDNRSASSSPLERKNDLYQLFMIFAVGLPFSRRPSSSKSPIHYYASAMQYAEEVLSLTDGETQIQNTLLLLVFAHQHATGIGSRWKLARQAMRTCIQLGYHRAPSKPLDAVTEQRRRRLFWCCYVQERFAACGLGRPIAIADHDITVEMPDYVCLDDLEKGLDTSIPNGSEVAVLIRQSQLRRISTKVREQLYARRTNDSFQAKAEAATQLYAELEQWRLLHEETSTISHSPCIFLTKEYMEVNFHREKLFIFSTLVVPTGQEAHVFKPDVTYLRHCLDPAVQIIFLYQTLLAKGVKTTLWTWIQDILRSGFMILYCGIHTSNILSSQNENAASSIATNQIPEPQSIIKALDDCRQMLKDISLKFTAVTPHWVAFDRLSCDVRKLIENSSSPGAILGGHNDMSVNQTMNQGLWDVPMDMSYWDDLLDGDVNMNEVFGFDMNTFA
ncbi:fungal-specific transcription factor domain-containing protein [Trichoderma sp. SZMC 28011]